MTWKYPLARSGVATLAVVLLGACASGPSGPVVSRDTSPASPALVQLEPGVFRLPDNNADGLLTLPTRSDVKVLVLADADPSKFSEAHLRALSGWIRGGGVAWVEGRDIGKGLFNSILPVTMHDFPYHKAPTGKRGGELIVKGQDPRLVIHDTPLTAGVDRLFIYPRWSFDGTPGAQPIIEMTDVDGRHGVVVAEVPLGRGAVVLDGTARETKTLSDRITGFDEDHPNAAKQGGEWNSYDWNRLVANASNYAGGAFGNTTSGTGSTESVAP